MKVGGVRFGRLGTTTLDAIYAAATAAALNYDHVGSTLAAGLPDARLRRVERSIGHGADVFEAAAAGIRTWVAQRTFGARIHPSDVPIAVNRTVVVVLSFGPIAVAAPTRIVVVIDEPDRFGFAYGTLPGHPVRGEESFVVTRAADGLVTASIAIDARPATLLTRLGGPLTRLMQSHAIRRYLDGIESAGTGRAR